MLTLLSFNKFSLKYTFRQFLINIFQQVFLKKNLCLFFLFKAFLYKVLKIRYGSSFEILEKEIILCKMI